MSEKIYACLLRLYPAKFRRAHGEDALQLFRDRLRDETGFLPRLRLWLDIFLDLAVSVPLQYASRESAFGRACVPHTAGVPLFLGLESESLRPFSLASGGALPLAVLSLATGLLNQTGRCHGLNFGSAHAEFLA